MSDLNTLQKIIPPDQALANKALARSLRQVKEIFNTDLPSLSQVVGNLESNKDLPLVNSLTTPVPTVVSNAYVTIVATGTGPGNTVTLNDVIGVAAGATVTTDLPVVTQVVNELADAGALDQLTGNGGTANSSVNGVYTVMQYALANSYTSSDPGPPVTFTITIPAPLAGQGTYGPDQSFSNVINSAFVSLIASANVVIANIASNNSEMANIANDGFNACANQLVLNVDNCTNAGIDIGNVVNDLSNANVIANSVGSVLGLASRLHEIGLDESEGGAAQFFEQVANTSNLPGQAVIASMREGRNIALLNSVGITLDTQISDVNPDPQLANNISSGQYTAAQAQANIII